MGQVEPSTPLWHAINVVLGYDWFTYVRQRAGRNAAHGALIPDEADRLLKEASEISFMAGMSAAAFDRKPLEYEVVAMKEAKRKRGAASGQASNNKRAARVAAFWSEIEALADLFPKMTEERIVAQAFENAVANDPDLWRQGKGQMEAYLSDDIRSTEPYKSQYYALFQKTP
ncbi:hypothetical protein [Celeribacter arenosi]|uniref:Uncharacterized protein n=1 Tax=Celeribacter arenosi TaxID=792649 RepID=A0ABP7K8R0_9RHOB